MEVDAPAYWLRAMRAMTCSVEEATAYLDRRLRFTTAVANELSRAMLPDQQRLVYGVWLDGHAQPVYIGQTSDGRRRLWDLPIGESHHLANSFPPEIWQRVVVVYWHSLILHDRVMMTEVTETLDARGISDPVAQAKAIGLGIEHLLQREYHPLLNMRKKQRNGGWRGVGLQESRSLAAMTAPVLTHLFARVLEIWQSLAVLTPSGDEGHIPVEGGRVVFPGALRDTLLLDKSCLRSC